MFDIGFTELMLVALIGLIVIGPERMPKVARTLGHLLGRVQRYVNDVKDDINREMQLEDLKKLQAEVSAQARHMEQAVNEKMQQTEAEIDSAILADKDESSISGSSPAEAEAPLAAAKPPPSPSA